MRDGRPPNYPWDRWLKKGSHRLVRGKHFKCEMLSIITLIRVTAAKRKVKISLRTRGNAVTIFSQGRKVA